MRTGEIADGVANLETIDYGNLFITIDGPAKMLVLFYGACSNYEKRQLARIATDANADGKVFKEQIDDSAHVGNGFRYQLDPTRFELAPV